MPHDADNQAGNLLRLNIKSNPAAVRAALTEAGQTWHRWDLDPNMCAAAELVLAEALNNVVEHAHADSGTGEIVMANAVKDGELWVVLHDDGNPMPNGQVPSGVLADLPDDPNALPEGGFGWFLIHQMTRNLSYSRDKGWNCLSFSVPKELYLKLYSFSRNKCNATNLFPQKRIFLKLPHFVQSTARFEGDQVLVAA